MTSRSKQADDARAEARTAHEHRVTLTAMRDQLNTLLATTARSRSQHRALVMRRDAINWVLDQTNETGASRQEVLHKVIYD